MSLFVFGGKTIVTIKSKVKHLVFATAKWFESSNQSVKTADETELCICELAERVLTVKVDVKSKLTYSNT